MRILKSQLILNRYGTICPTRARGNYVCQQACWQVRLVHQNLSLDFAKKFNRHALGNRARKAGQGILTVRFEMPYPIWCTTCPKPTIIGQGVRFNAEKKKVGNYHSSPIYSFRMKHNICGGWIEIRTDPKNTAYVVTEGGKKRDTGDDKVLEGDLRMRSEEERERLRNDAFAALEVKIDDQKHMAISKSRIEELQLDKDKNWDDPYAASKNLRRVFRADRKARQNQEALSEDLKDRMSLGIHLLEENEDDRRRAGFVEFGQAAAEEGEIATATAILKAKSKPLFAQTTPTPLKLPPKQNNIKLKKVAESQQKREKIRKELGDNTRAALDPFLNDNNIMNNRSSSFSSSAIIPARKLKKGPPDLSSSLSSSPVVLLPEEEKSTILTGLGDYDSE